MRCPGARRLAVVVLASTCGCSFVAVRRPPSEPPLPGAPLECTDSRFAPRLDTVGAVATPVVGLVTWSLCSYLSAMQSWSSDPTHLKCGAVVWTALLATGAYAGSAVYGYHYTGECRRMHDRAAVLPDDSRPR